MQVNLASNLYFKLSIVGMGTWIYRNHSPLFLNVFVVDQAKNTTSGAVRKYGG